jgi:hypothetical protein
MTLLIREFATDSYCSVRTAWINDNDLISPLDALEGAADVHLFVIGDNGD